MIRRMFGKLADAILRRRDERRGLYRLWDGRRWRRLDWLRVYRAFLADPVLTDEATAQAVEAQGPETDRYLDALARLFGVRRYDPQTGDGLTDEELFAAFAAFSQWILQKKMPSGNSPTASPSTARRPSVSTTPSPTTSGL
ncbi:hypothetical protein [Thermostilla marina]